MMVYVRLMLFMELHQIHGGENYQKYNIGKISKFYVYKMILLSHILLYRVIAHIIHDQQSFQEFIHLSINKFNSHKGGIFIQIYTAYSVSQYLFCSYSPPLSEISLSLSQ